MGGIPQDLRFARSHEWLKSLPDGAAEVGISDHAQQQLGDLVFIELPDVGRTLAAGEACAVLESVKAASDVFAPIAGTVLAVNEQLRQSPGLVNRDPYGAGWLLRLKPAGAGSTAGLMTAADYAAMAAAT
jgi:glycine cleavage system H protein